MSEFISEFQNNLELLQHELELEKAKEAAILYLHPEYESFYTVPAPEERDQDIDVFAAYNSKMAEQDTIYTEPEVIPTPIVIQPEPEISIRLERVTSNEYVAPNGDVIDLSIFRALKPVKSDAEVEAEKKKEELKAQVAAFLAVEPVADIDTVPPIAKIAKRAKKHTLEIGRVSMRVAQKAAMFILHRL